MGTFQDLTGRTFGRLKVEGLARRARPGKHYWKCICECGKRCEIQGGSLRTGHTISCGCWHREVIETQKLKHGHTRKHQPTPEYEVWCGIIKRCCNQNAREFKWYGGRGIQICERWRSSFAAFLEDVGLRPSPRHSIDRIDTNGHYEPNNVRWATQKEQMRNQRRNRMLTINGETHCVSEWAEIAGIKRELIKDRLKKGWPEDERLLLPKTR